MTGRQAELEQREKRRRAALRNLQASDFVARRAALMELKTILELDRIDPIGEAAGLLIDELHAQIHARLSSHGIPYLLNADMPEPWRTRFWAATPLSLTMKAPGPYYDDWENFLSLWQQEHKILADRLLDLDDT